MNVNNLIEKSTSIVRHAAGRAERFTRHAGGVAEGLRHRVTGSTPKPGMDDITLTRKVETVVFRPERAPKGSIDVNTVDGVVFLRGQVKNAAQIKAIEAAVRAVPEVRDVENLLHQRKTPARGAKRQTSAPNRTTRVSTEERTAKGEPAPDELAAKREGRQPAPLGAEDPDARA